MVYRNEEKEREPVTEIDREREEVREKERMKERGREIRQTIKR